MYSVGVGVLDDPLQAFDNWSAPGARVAEDADPYKACAHSGRR